MPRSLRVRHDCIDKVKVAVLQSGYPNQRALSHDTGLSLTTVSKFLTGKPIDYVNFEELCSKLNLEWQEISIPNLEITSKNNSISTEKIITEQHTDWGTAYDISTFYGRKKELKQLKSWILQDRCRLLAVVGMGGVGKTTLVTQLAKQIQDQFDYVFWRSVHTIPNFDNMITDMLDFISHHQESKPNINHLINYLRNHRCLIILDNLETALNAGDTEYNKFFRIIAETQHQSCIIFTSRLKPPPIKLLQKWSSSVHCLRLHGSSEIAFPLLQSKQLLGTEKQKYQLCDLYSNNPLIIKIITHSIIDFFDGDIEQFLAQNTLLINHHISILVQQQFNYLSFLEKQIMYHLATNEKLVTINYLTNKLPYISISDIYQAVEKLYSRCLIENKSGKYILAPIIIEYVQTNFNDNLYPFMNL